MKRPLGAFATLAALVVLVLLAGLLSAGALSSLQLEGDIHRSSTLARAQSLARLDQALRALQTQWNPPGQTFTSWRQEHPMEGVSWESLSGRVNLNTVTIFLLASPGLAPTLKNVSPQQFADRREKAGPASSLTTYLPIIRPEFVGWFTVHSLWNLNTADETMLEAMATERTGSAAVGSSLRAQVRTWRSQKKRVGVDEWTALVQSIGTGLAAVTTVDPEVDVNEAPHELLDALLSYPDWQVSDPHGKAAVLVQGRSSRPWTPYSLRALLQVPEDDLVLSVLGTHTTFLGGTVAAEGGFLDWVVSLGADPLHPAPRIIELSWRRS